MPTLREYLLREIQKHGSFAVAKRLGVSYRILPTYVCGACKFRSAAIIEQRAEALGWPPEPGDDAPPEES